MLLKKKRIEVQRQLEKVYNTREAKALLNILLEEVLNMSSTALLLEKDTLLSEIQNSQIEQIVFRLQQQEPIQYIFGKAPFYGNTFCVNKHTLIPRPETEELVDFILKKHAKKSLEVIDIGTGSGCIPISLKLNRPTWKISASDISTKALEVATKNASIFDTKITFYLGLAKKDIFISK